MLSRVQKLSLGFAHWGNQIIHPTTKIRTVQLAVQHGIKRIDCAPLYGKGKQESILGIALDSLPGELLNSIEISSKAGIVFNTNEKSILNNGFTSSTAFTPKYDYSAQGILASFEQSQLRLGLSSLHTLYIHDLDPLTHGDNYAFHMQNFLSSGRFALEELKKQKKIEKIGIGTNDAKACAKLLKQGLFSIDEVMLAGSYNLLDQSALDEVIPVCGRYHMPLYIAAPYGGGLLSGQVNNHFFRYQTANAETLKKTTKIKEICEKYGITLPHAAMQFVHANEYITGVVVGARIPDELKISLQAAIHPICREFWMELVAEQLIPEKCLSYGLLNQHSQHSELFSSHSPFSLPK